jgi:hypothetical protein
MDITVTRSGNGATVRASIDHDEMTFLGDIATTPCGPGKHVLSWTVTGNPGSTYSVSITDPSAIGCGGHGTIGPHALDFGACPFFLP